MKKLLVFAVLVGCGYLVLINSKTKRAVTLSETERTRLFADASSPCAGKSQCFVLYMAPWCPSCRNYANIMLRDVASEIERNFKSVGFAPTLGLAEKQEVDAWGATFGVPYLYDANKNLFRAMGLDSVPSLLVFESDGNGHHVRDTAAHGDTKELAIRKLLSEKLGLRG